VFGILGVAGIVISVAAYVPQVIHLARERCSAGVSSRAWGMWLASSLLVGSVAVHRRDPIFVLLQTCTLASAIVTLVLARRYRGMACESHASPVSGQTLRGKSGPGGRIVRVSATKALQAATGTMNNRAGRNQPPPIPAWREPRGSTREQPRTTQVSTQA
jgi:lipid-A-disaccharide synthase-like uncharacterized protein